MEDTTTTTSDGVDWSLVNNWDTIMKGLVPDYGTSGSSSGWGDLFKNVLTGLTTPAGAITGLAGLYSVFGNKGPQVAGYGGGIPMLKASREVLPETPPGAPEPKPRAYGDPAMGRRYFSDVSYTPVATTSTGGASGGSSGGGGESGGSSGGGGNTDQTEPPKESGLARGGMPRYLQGPTDGMADKLNTSIDGRQPAKLSHGEFVIPADVVSHLGNGNSDAGAKVLYKMMDRVRQARTGTTKQGKRINPDKFTPGGIAGYAGGGAVAFDGGGSTGTTSTTTFTPGAFPTSTSTASNLSAWAGPYVTDYLGKAMALSGMGFTPYTGQLTAGISPLMKTGFEGITSFMGPNTSFTSPGATAGAPSVAQSYMSPYIQNVLDVQKQQAQREADIQAQTQKARFATSGAFGGARQAIEQGRANEALARQKADIQATGMQSAFQQAQQQYNQEREMGLRGLGAMLGAGQLQRGVEKEALDAMRGQFEEERMWPYKQLQFMQSMIQGLPVGTQTTSAQLSPLQQTAGTVGGLQSIYDVMSRVFK